MNEARYLEDDFIGFLEEVVKSGMLESPEKGISQLAIDKGWESLTEKQQYRVKKAIEPVIQGECSRCRNEIPWCEMMGANVFEGKCSWCYQLDKDD